VLLASAAGAADTLAFFSLGGAFGGIVTGNLVTAGYGAATGHWALVRPTATAIAACVAGELAWAWLLRLPRAATWLLLAELALFLSVFGIWLAAGSHPAGAVGLTALALVAAALGGQSMWALRIHQTTTYFTGMLTKAVDAAVAHPPGRAGLGASARQLAALLAGALLGGAALHWLRPAAPAVPLALLALAAVVHVRASRAGHRDEARRPVRPEPATET
jgi:uncharacterized membrane protein YoaK (UPF0700 family)